MIKAETFQRNALINGKNPFIRMEGVIHKAPHRFVCPKCYGLTLTETRKTDADRRFQSCVICGWHGPKESTMTLLEVLEKETIKKGGQVYLR